MTVRVLVEIHAALMRATQETGRSPQYVVDDALREWLMARGYLIR